MVTLRDLRDWLEHAPTTIEEAETHMEYLLRFMRLSDAKQRTLVEWANGRKVHGTALRRAELAFLKELNTACE